MPEGHAVHRPARLITQRVATRPSRIVIGRWAAASVATRPCRIVITRSAAAATRGSWVIMPTVSSQRLCRSSGLSALLVCKSAARDSMP